MKALISWKVGYTGMSTTMYCPNCGRNTQVTRWTTGSIVILIILLILGIILGLIYLVYKVTQPEKCTVCGCPASHMEAPRPTKKVTESSQTAGTTATGEHYCINCGAKIEDSVAFCPSCGTKQEKN